MSRGKSVDDDGGQKQNSLFPDICNLCGALCVCDGVKSCREEAQFFCLLFSAVRESARLRTKEQRGERNRKTSVIKPSACE